MINNRKNIKLNSILIFLWLFANYSGYSQPQNCWTNFRGDPMLTGVSDVTVSTSPELIWSFQTSDDIKAPPVMCNNTIVIGSADGNVYGLSTEGKLKWKLKTDNSIEAPALIIDNTVFVGNLQGSLYAIELTTGRLKWTYQADNMIMGSPNYYQSGGKTVIIVGSYDYFLHGVDAATGKGLWKYEANNYINGAPAIYEGKAIFGGCDGLLHLVNAASGELISRFEIATYVASSAAIVDHIAYVGDYDGSFSALDIKTRKALWVYRDEESRLPFIGSASVDGDRVFIGNRDRYMYCLDKNSGKVIWKVNTGSRVDASPVKTVNGVLVANMRGDLLLYNPENGQIIWSYEIGSPVSGNPAVTENFIVAGAADGRVYCFSNR